MYDVEVYLERKKKKKTHSVPDTDTRALISRHNIWRVVSETEREKGRRRESTASPHKATRQRCPTVQVIRAQDSSHRSQWIYYKKEMKSTISKIEKAILKSM